MLQKTHDGFCVGDVNKKRHRESRFNTNTFWRL